MYLVEILVKNIRKYDVARHQ